jgi:hypothetical protein
MTLQNENIEDLTDDELEARQKAEDEQSAEKNAPAPDPEAQSAVVEGETKPAEPPPEPAPEKVTGVASKDGTRVLPYAALQSERRSARQATSRAERAEQERDALRQQLEDMKAGKPSAPAQLTEDDVADMEENFPEQGKKLRAAFERTKELEAKVPKAAAQEEDYSDDPIQEAIDQVPMLVTWQHSDAEKFARAQAIDTALQDSPKWRGRPVVERFAHVARQVADEYDIPLQDEKPSTSTPSADPQRVIETATRAKPSTLSDFKGGASPDHGNVAYDKLSPADMLSRFDSMTDEQMEAHLAKLG